jgi:uncharacterized peroxidase-related enzyme
MTTAGSNHSRVPLAERNEVPVEVAILYDKLLADRGVVPNMFKALSNVPDLVLGTAAFLHGLMAEGALPGWYKELVSIRIASLNECEYCISSHRNLALKRGASADHVAKLDHYEKGPFSEKEKAGFRYADLVHTSGHAVDDHAFAALKKHFNPQEIIELTAVASAFEFFTRMITALRIPVTPLPQER